MFIKLTDQATGSPIALRSGRINYVVSLTAGSKVFMLPMDDGTFPGPQEHSVKESLDAILTAIGPSEGVAKISGVVASKVTAKR